MTKAQFLKKYHDYSTTDAAAAKQEAEDANHEGIDGDQAVAVNFGHAWGLMLKSAYDFIKPIALR